MKTIMVIFALWISAIQVSGQEAISNVSLKMTGDREVISFTLPREVNVRHYRIEASNDKTNFDVIGTFASKGNSMLSREYNYELSNASYKYYRVVAVGMSTNMQYSAVVAPITNDAPQMAPGYSAPLHTDVNVITKN